MATLADAYQIVGGGPGTVCDPPTVPEPTDEPYEVTFLIDLEPKPRKFLYSWRKRVHPRKPKVPQPDVLVVWVPELADKEALLASEPDKYFTEPHYDGYQAVLARIDRFSRAELEELIVDTWRLAAPDELVPEDLRRRFS
jgi:hypothetical protein